MVGTETISAAIVTQEGESCRAVCIRADESGETRVIRVLDEEPMLVDFCSKLEMQEENDGLDVFVARASMPEEDISQAAASCLFGDGFGDANGEFTFRVQRAFKDHGTSVAVLTISEEASSKHAKSILAFASRLAERVARYGVEDKLACMQILVDARLSARRVEGRGELERAEFYASELLGNVCEESKFSDKVATCDFWLYYVSDNSFVSPSESFRRVSSLNGNRVFPETDVDTIRDVYESEFAMGRLIPRPLGKTNYMIANKKAIVINKRDNRCHTTFWSSSHRLEVGSFIGIPFWFYPDGKDGVCFMAACYLRCIEDLSKEQSGKVVSEIVHMMKDFRGKRFVPMVKIKNEVDVQRQVDAEKGVWYEVQGKRRISQKKQPTVNSQA